MTEDDSGIDKAADDAAEALDEALTGDTELNDAVDADGDLASGEILDAADDAGEGDTSDHDGDVTDSVTGAAAAAAGAGGAAAGAAAGKAKKQIRTSAEAPKLEPKPKKERGYGGQNKRTIETDGSGEPKTGKRKAKTDKSNTAVKKVAQAAESGNSRDLSMSSRLGFPAIVGLVCILGLLLVTYARLTREPEVKPVQNRDHWHAAYGLYDCTLNDGAGGYLPPFLSEKDDEGIHSHQDGVIHIHPWFDSSDGPDAQLVKFLDSMNVQITDDAINLDTGAVLEAGVDCGGEEAVIHVRKWTFDFQVEDDDPEIITEDIPSIRFLNDREVYIIALAPLDAEIPPPPTERFETLNSVSQVIQSQRPADIADVEDDITFDVEPGDLEDDITFDVEPAEGTESGE